MREPAVVVIGGTSGIGLRVAESYAARGRDVVITGRDPERAAATASAVAGPGAVQSRRLDLSAPDTISECLASVGRLDRLVLSAGAHDVNPVRTYDFERAIRVLTLKLVGYTEVIHALAERLAPESSIVLFGGLSARRPPPGSTTMTTANGGVASLVRHLAVELAPTRVNAIHPGIVRDSPYWNDKPDAALENVLARTPLGRLTTMDDIVDACTFLLENRAVNGVNLEIDGGWLLK
jgi:NAD(P)-dependent dehydrogenase (short-subunit alcohol dehydrogenase family)